MAVINVSKTRLFLYNKNNKIIVKLNDVASTKEMKNQVSKKLAYSINIYLIKKNITIIKLRAAQTLPSGNIAIQITNQKKAEKLREKDR